MGGGGRIKYLRIVKRYTVFVTSKPWTTALPRFGGASLHYKSMFSKRKSGTGNNDLTLANFVGKKRLQSISTAKRYTNQGTHSLSPFISALENIKAPLKCHSELFQSHLLVKAGISVHSITPQDFCMPPGVAEIRVGRMKTQTRENVRGDCLTPVATWTQRVFFLLFFVCLFWVF